MLKTVTEATMTPSHKLAKRSCKTCGSRVRYKSNNACVNCHKSKCVATKLDTVLNTRKEIIARVRKDFNAYMATEYKKDMK